MNSETIIPKLNLKNFLTQKQKNMKKITILSILVLLTISCSNKNPEQSAIQPPTLPIMSINTSEANTESLFPVAIQGKNDIEIRAQVNGTLDKIFIDEGDYVSQGQSLFKINDNIYRQQYNNAYASLKAAEATVVNAQIEVDKLTPLVQNKVVSDFQLRTAKANLSIAKANVEQAKASLANAKINLDYTTIKAPVNGYIGRLPKKQGSLISPQDPEALTKLSDVKEVYAYFSLSENDFINFKSQYAGSTIPEKLKKLPQVTLILSDNSEYDQKGNIDMVDGQFNKTTGAITLRAKFPNKNGMLRSGNTGSVKISVNHIGSIMIPQESTIEIQDKLYVFLLDSKNTVTRQPITISGKSGTNYLVKDGIKEGDRIVLKGFENLPDGATIIPEKTKKTVAKL